MTASTVRPSATTTASRRTWRWRVVDIVVASVLAVACGFLFVVWNTGYEWPSALLKPLLPGLQGLVNGVWLIAGPLVALVVRKPGAALYGEVLAATVSALVGNQWGFTTLISGLVQGVGAELVFAAFLYGAWRWWTALLAGAAAGVGGALYELVAYYGGATAQFGVTYTVCYAVSGALLAGLLAWLLVRALAATGALSRFPVGRERMRA